jgi:Fe-S cluster assembly ATP-binding protein
MSTPLPGRSTSRIFLIEILCGVSGGEIKRSELLQLMGSEPDLVLFDEPESGVDLENISLIGNTINALLERRPTTNRVKRQKQCETVNVPTPFKTVKKIVESRSKMG